MPKNQPFLQRAYGILNLMKGGKKAHGFTIVETLVVIAITGVLFSAIVVTLSGRQSKTEFTQAIQEIQSQIQQTIDDVGTGYYPNGKNFQCTASLAGPQFTSSATTDQGANAGCVFLGKAIQLGVPRAGGLENFNIFTIAGLQRTPDGKEVQSYSDAKPTPISPPITSIDATEKKQLLYGLTTLKATYGSSDTSVGTIAFVNSLASYNDSLVVSGSQQVQVIPIRTSALGSNQQNAASAVQSQLANSDVNPSGGVKICFVSGGTDQSGLITIGGNGRQASVTLNIKGNKTCS
jgi:prepilin-type N-terminal cleavage/methylation domain-containing protein